jgi:hypothetical protein
MIDIYFAVVPGMKEVEPQLFELGSVVDAGEEARHLRNGIPSIFEFTDKSSVQQMINPFRKGLFIDIQFSSILVTCCQPVHELAFRCHLVLSG